MLLDWISSVADPCKLDLAALVISHYILTDDMVRRGQKGKQKGCSYTMDLAQLHIKTCGLKSLVYSLMLPVEAGPLIPGLAVHSSDL